MKKIITLCFLMALVCVKGWAQPAVLGTSLVNGTYTTYNLNAVGGFKQYRLTATSSAAANARIWEFAQGTAASTDYTTNWRPNTSGNTLSTNLYIPTSFANGAKYNTGSGGASGLLQAITSGNYYTFNVSNNSSSDNIMQLLETNYNPVTISSVAQAAGTYGSRRVTVTTSTTPASGENIYLRYSTNNYSTSTLVQAAGSGTTWTATIPWQSGAVSFYVYTSNKILSAINSDVTTYGQGVHDMSTLSLNNNGGINYSWTPATGAIIVSSAGGTFASGIGYTSLTNASGAFLALNSAASGTGAVTILITADVTTEAGTNALAASTNWATIVMQPSGARTISGSVGTNTTGAPMIDFNGADNVTINGLNDGTNSLTISNTSTANGSTTSTIRFYNDATSNIVTNTTILGSSTTTTSTNGGTIYFGANASSIGNDNNTISNCNIGPAGSNLPTKAIFGNGSQTTTALGNSGNLINNNNIYDYFGTAVASAGIYLGGGNNTWSITNNRFYQTATRTWTTGAQHSGIYISSTTATYGAQGYSITGNTIGYASNTQTGTYTLTGSAGLFFGIYFNGISTGTATTISSNTIASVSLTGVSTSGTGTNSPFAAVMFVEGVGTTSSNIIGSQSATGSLVFSSSSTTATDIYGIYNFSSNAWTSNSNTIGGITATNAATTSAFVVYGLRANTGTTVTWAATSNTIGGAVANSIQNNSTSTTSQTFGLYSSQAPVFFTSNTVRNIVAAGGTGTGTAASIIGISTGAASSVNHTISQNTIYGLSNSNTSSAITVTGIIFGSNSATTNLIAKNFIHSLNVASTTGIINGISINSGTATYQNNMIRLGIDASGAPITTACTINGINESIAGTDKFYFNSVYIGGSGVGTTASNTYALYSTITTNPRAYQDNIFFNARSNASTGGKHYGIRVGGTAPNPTGLTSNYNDIYTSGTGGVFGIFNSTDVASLSAWTTATGQDGVSQNADPQFILAGGTSASVNLHINTSTPTLVEGTGLAISGITDDYDGDVRSSNSPTDIGADAGLFTAVAGTVTLGSNTIAAGNITGGTNNNPIYSFSITPAGANATLTGLSITTAGSYISADLTNLKVYYSSLATFATGTSTLLSTLANPGAAGAKTFTLTTNATVSAGATGYIYITADAACIATGGNTMSVNAVTSANTTFTAGTLSGTPAAGNTQTFVAATAVNATAFAASVAAGSSVLSWTAPAGCYDQLLIVASSGSANTGIPTGDGTAYTGNLTFGSGTALGNGFVVYQGTTTPETVTGLTNGTTYYFKIFTRLGTVWSAGNEVSVVPALVYCTSTGPSTQGSDYITNFTTTGGTTNITNTSTYSANGYGDFTAQTVTQVQGGTVNYSSTTPGIANGSTFGIFVDWNQNGVFTDAGENVVSLGASTQITANPSGNFSVPAGAMLGNTRMRVIVKDASGAVVSCNTALANSETEDYTFTVTAPITYTWTGTTSTDWNTATNWSGGVVPTSSSAVIIPSVTNQPNIGVAANAGSITLNSGSSLTINSTLTVAGNWTNNGATSVTGTGSVTMSGNGTTIGGTASTTFPNLNIASTGNVSLGINTTVTGNLAQAGVFGVSASSSSYTLTIGGNFTQTGGTTYISYAASNSTMNVAGTLGVSAGYFILEGSTTTTGATVTVAGAGGTTISGSGEIIMDNAGTTATCSFQTTAFTANGTGDATNFFSLNFGSGSSINHCQFKISGNFSHSSTNTFFTSALSQVGSFIFNGTGTQTFSYAGTNSAYTSYTVNTGATLQLLTNLTMASSGSPSSIFTVNGIIDFQTFSIGGASSSETFTLGAGATVKTANTAGVYAASTTTGSILSTLSARTFDATANYTFNSTSAQTTNFNGTTAATMANLTISNSAGVTNNAANTVNGILAFTSGKLTTTTTNTLTLGTAATTSGASATSYVNGPLIRLLPATPASTTVYDYPVGATTYLPYAITNVTTSAATSLQVQAFTGAPTGTADGTTLGALGTEYWQATAKATGYSGASVSIARQTTLGNLNVIGKSTTNGAASYSSIGGTVSGNSVVNSAATGAIASGASQYYALAQADYTITSSVGSGAATGTITPNGITYVPYNTNQAYTITPATGYHITDVKVDGVTDATAVSSGTYTFSNVSASHTIVATFAINIYTLTYTAGPDGTISGTSPQTVNYNTSGTAVTAVPVTGYHFVQWSDGSTTNPRTDANVTANITVTANFAINTYTLTYTAGSNGSISGTTPQTVSYGNSGTSVTAVANTGYHFVQWSDGLLTASRTDASVTADVSVTASFAINSYTLTYDGNTNTGGTAPTSVVGNYNTTTTVSGAGTLVKTGHMFTGWNTVADGSGTAYPAGSTFTFAASTTLYAQWTINTYTLTYDGNTSTGGTAPTVVTQNYNTTVIVANQGTLVKTGYTFTGWNTTADGTGTAYAAGDVFTFTANTTLYAQWTIITYTFTSSAGTNGSINPNGTTTVNYGTNSTFTITPSTGYHVDVLTVDGSAVTSATTYTFTNVTANHTISATFAINTYTITSSVSGGNGTINPGGTTIVNYGVDQNYTMNPDVNYSVQDVLVDGVSVGAVTSYLFTNVTANHTISVSFYLTSCPNPPTANAGSNGSVCSNASYTLSGSIGGGASTATWSTSGSGIFNGGTAFGSATSYTPSAADIIAGNVTITLTTDNPDASVCTAATSSFTLTINAAPNASIGGGAAQGYCVGSSLLLTSTSTAGSGTITSYQWNNNGSPITSATSSTYTAISAGAYTVTITNSNGCIATSAAVTVSENAAPATSIDGGNSQSFCAGGSLVLTSTNTAGSGTIAGYQWNQVGSPISGATNSSYTATAAGSYTLTVTNSNGCITTSSAVTVSVNPATVITSQPTGASYCQNATATALSVTATGTGTLTYQWFSNTTNSTSGSTSLSGATTSSYTPSTATAGSTYYYVVVSSPTCASTTSNIVSVVVNPTPAAPTVTASGPTTFCSGGSITLTSSYATGNTWSTGATTQSITVSTSGSYSVTYSNGTCNSPTSATTVVTVNPTPAAPTVTTSGSTTFCAGGSVTLTSSYATGNTWSTGATTQSIVVSASGNYSVTYNNGNCTSPASATTTVTVNPAPTVSVSASCTSIFTSGSSTLTANASGSGILSYQWYSNTTNSNIGGTLLSGATSSTYTASPATTTYYYVVVTSSVGTCSTTSGATGVTVVTGALAANTYLIGSTSCDFKTIASAVNYINTNGITGTGGVIFNVAAGYTETTPAGGFVITATGTLGNPIVFQKSGTGTNPIITAGIIPSSPGGNRTDAIFKIIGGDYITIDGFTMQENAANTVNTLASNTKTEFGVALLYASATNGAQNNTIQNNTITLSSTYQNAIGIYSNTRHTDAAPTVTADATATSGLNIGLKVYGNTISNVVSGIQYISPANTATITESGVEIGGATASTGNTITYSYNLSADAIWAGYSNVSAAINYRNGVAANIRNNTINSSSVSAYATTGILISSATTPSGVTYTNTISNNTINITQSGAFAATGIDFGYSLSTGTIIANANTVTLTQTSAAANSASVTAINAAYTSATNTVSNNIITINQSNSTGATTSTVTGLSTAGIGTTVNVTGNTISIKQAISGTGSFGAGTVYYINTSATSGTINVTGNTLNTTGSTIRSTGTLYGVFQDATVTTLVNVKSNTANIDRVAASGTAYFQYTSGSPSEVADTVSNNAITFTNLAGTSVATAINSGGGPSTPGVNNKSISNNTISITGTNTGTSIGITASFTNTGKFTGNAITINTASATVTGLTTSSTAATVSGNILSLSSSTTSPTAMTGISVSGTGAHSITANTFSGLNFTGVVTASPTVSGIACSGNAAANIFGNTITNISVGAAGSTASPTIDGILISGGTSVNVFKNKIYGLTTAATGATTVVNGIRLSGGTANNVYNNLIGNLTAPAAASIDAIRGISITSTTTLSTHKVYYNTIYLNATSTGTTFGTTGIYHITSTTATTSSLDLRNNIVINLSTPNGTGITTALRRSTTSLTNYASTSNNNMFYAGTPGATKTILYDGTNAYQTFTSFQTAVAARETASFTGETGFTYSTPGSFFQSLTGSAANFLHIVAGITTQAESGAQAIAGFTDDYDGDTRPNNTTTNTPDVGADEFVGVPLDKIGPTITYTALTNNCGGGSRTLTATITDASGVPTSGTGLPVLYWKVGAASTYTASQATSLGSNQYQFTLGTGSAAGDVIQYYIVAQDAATTPNVSVSPSAGAGGLTANPPAASTPPTTPSSYTNLSLLSGIYSVGTGNISGEAGHYTTLTAAVADYNTKCLGGAVQFVLTDATYSTSETFPIVINANNGSSATNTLTIKLNTGVTTTITGSSVSAIIKLNGADYVTIDGSNSGGTDKSLTITNTNTGTSSADIWVASTTTDGATNNTIKNTILAGNSGTTTTGNIIVSGSTIGSAAEVANSNITVANNTMSKAQNAVFAIGNATTPDANWTVTNNTIGSTVTAEKGYRGIAVQNVNTFTISGNQIVGVNTATSSTASGILVGGLATNGTVFNNIIQDVKNTITSGFGSNGIYLSSTSTTANIQVYDNMISDVASYGYASGNGVADNGYGIIVTSGAGYRIYYNSVNLTTNQTVGNSAAFNVTIGVTAAGAIDLRDNIFANSQTANTRYAIYSGAGSTVFSNIDYNDYYSTGTLGYIVSARTDLAGIQAGFGGNTHSVAVDPVFVSATDLHLQTTSTLESKGTPISGITTDIDGQTRNATTPDIGADEYDAVFCAPGTGTTQGGTATYSGSAVCNSGSATITATGYAAGINVTYQWEYSNDNFVSDVHDLTGQTTASSATATVSSTTYFRLREFCSSSSTTYYSTIATVTVNNPLVATTTPGVRCGVGTVALAATGSTGTTLNWYAASTGGTPIGTGSPFTTPSISATTTYYVTASTGGSTANVGPATPTAEGGTIGTQTASWDVNFTTLTAATLQSVSIFPIASGQAGVIQVLSGTGSGGTILATINYTTNVSGGATAQIIPINYVIATPGAYSLYMSTMPSSGLSRNISGATYPYTSSAAKITGNGFDATYYMGLYNWLFSTGCESARTPVIATVNTAPTFTVSNAASVAVCNGSSTPFTVTSTLGDYDTYTWTVTGGSLYLDAAGTTPYIANSSATTVYFVSSTAGAATVTANASSTSTTCTAIATKSVTVLPATVTATAASTSICSSGSTTLSLSPSTAASYTSGTIQWQNSTTGTSGPWTDIAGASSTTFTTPTITTTTYYQALIKNSDGTSCLSSNVVTVTVNNPLVASTTPASRCGVGTVTLAATGSTGTTLNWYAASTGGTPIGTGSPFTTPSISATTTYYVGASTGSTTGSLGAVSPSVGAFGNSFTGSYEIFDVTGGSSTINSVDIYGISAGTVVIELRNSSGILLQTAPTYTVTATQANSTSTTVGTPITIPVGFAIPAGTGYRLNLGTTSTATMIRNTSGATATYGPVSGVTITGNSNATTGYYYNFYNWSVTNGCESARTPVTATVNTAPTVSIAASQTLVCSTNATPIQLTASSSNDPNYTYTWAAPISAVGATQSVTPTATTTYTVNAVDNTSGTYNTCTATANVTITVSKQVTPTITATSTKVCSGTTVTLTANTTSTSGSYCTPVYTLSDGTDYISKVELLNSTGTTTLYSRTSGATALPGYDNETALTTTTLTAGSTYTVRVTNGATDFSENVAIFLDYNSDNLFTGTSETLLSSTSVAASSTTGLVTFTVPAAAYNGSARLRVVLAFSNAATSCMSSGYGETEDYNVTIAGGGTNPSNSTYLWSTGATTQTITINPTATASYTVTASNANGCSATSDPTTVTVAPPLAGIYSVGSSNIASEAGHYSTLTAALADYNGLCLGGPVTLALTDATYSTNETFPITINANSGASSTNTLTIKPYAGVNATITGNITTSIFKLNGADYVTIDGSNSGGTDRSLSIVNSNTGTTGMGVWIASTATDGATNNTVKNVIVKGNSSTTTFADIISSGSTAGNAAEVANNNNVYQNDSLTTAQYGIGVVGTATGDAGTVITGNSVGSTVAAQKLGFRGIFVSNQTGATVSSNTITGVLSSNTSSTSPSGGIIVIGATTNTLVSKNKITDIKNTSTAGYASYGIDLQSSSTTSGNTISNNFISDVAGYGDASIPGDNGHGIAVTAGGGYSIYYNNISLATSETTSGNITSALYVSSAITTSATLTVENNILSNTETVGNSYAIYSGAASSVYSVIDYNDYYGNADKSLGNIGSLDQATLPAIQTGFGGNTHSVSVQPLFASAADLHLTSCNSGLDGKGTTITGITTDIDGDTRNTTTPDIGADEFTSVNALAAITANPSTPVCAGTNVTLTETGGTATSWSWSTGAITQSITVAPAVTTTYTVTATTGSCSYPKSIIVSVNPLPSAATVTPSNSIICAGSVQTLTASATDPATLLSQNFNTTTVGSLPTGWTSGSTVSTTSTWGAVVSANAGGTANEMRYLFGGSSENGTFYLQAPVTDATSASSLSLTFNYMLDNYDATTYPYILKVQSSTDQTTWTDRWSITPPSAANIAANSVTVNLGALDGNATVYLRFALVGQNFGLDYWYIDNVSVTGQKASSNITWSPTTGLYTDAAATTAYTGGQATTLYAKPTATTTYTVTNSNGSCSNSSTTTTVTVNPLPTAAFTKVKDTTCYGTSATLVISGTPNATAYYHIGGSTTAISVTLNTSGIGTITTDQTAGSTTATTNVIYTLDSAKLSTGCLALLNSTLQLTIEATPTIALTSAAGTNSQTVCRNNAITDIKYTFGGSATSVVATNLPAGLTQSVSGNVLTISGTPTASGTFTVTTVGNKCTSVSLTGTVTISPYITWTGATSTDWSVATNWCSGTVPTATDDVIIPNVTNKPTLSANTQITGLEIQTGATVDLNGKDFTTGAVSGSGKIIGALPSTITTTATGTINFDAAHNTIRNLVVNVGTLTLGNALNIKAGTDYGIVSVGNGANLVTNGLLTLKSDTLGTAAIAAHTGSTNYITGNVIAEQFIPISNITQTRTGRAWRLMTAPVSNTTIGAAWQENMLYDGSAYHTIGSGTVTTAPAGYGTMITGYGQGTAGNANGNGYDFWSAVANTTSSIRSYVPGFPTGSWQSITTISNKEISSEPAYMLFVRGDRKDTTQAEHTTLRAIGTVNQISKDFVVDASKVRILIGNPFPSTIDWGNIYSHASAYVEDKFLLWNSKIGTFGAYVLVQNDGSGNYFATPQVLGGNVLNDPKVRFIPSSAGFLVYPKASGTVSIVESDKNASQVPPANPFRLVNTDKKLYVNLNLKDNDTSATLADGLLVRFDNSYDTAVTDDDATKQSNFNENLGILNGTNNLIVEARPDVQKTDTLHMNLWNVKQRAYQLQMKGDNWTSAPNVHAYLVDNYLATKQEVTLSGTVTSINFTVNTDSASWKSDRFSIVFQNDATVLPVTLTSVKAAAQNGGVNVTWTVTNEQNIKTYTVERSINGGNSYTAIGSQQAKNQTAAAITNYQSFDAAPQTGSNLYRIRIETKEGVVTYSSVVTVVIGQDNGKILITLYPNPVRPNGKVSLQMSNLATGTYLVNVYSQAGQTVYQKKITISQPNTTQSEELRLGSALAQGSYELRISNSKGTIVYADKLVVGR